jgi:hypothetical protein
MLLLIRMVKLLFLIFFTSCSHYHNEKSISFYLKELRDYENSFAQEINNTPRDYPNLYLSQQLLNDPVVNDLYVSLGLKNLPKIYSADFGKNRISLALFNGSDIYINKEYWKDVPTTAKKMIILHELGHWVGMVHTDDADCIPAATSVMCGSTPDYNLGKVDEYLPIFLNDFQYLLMIKEQNSAYQ